MPNIPTATNNPGDLKGPGGQFTQYASPSHGYLALANDLYHKMTGATSTGLNGNSTIQDFTNVYAPASDNNNPQSYAQAIASDMGVSPNSKIGALDLKSFTQAVAKHEGYQGPPPQQFSPTDFANQLKSKYPQYQSLDNNSLIQKVLAKYPQYQVLIDQNAQAQQPDQPKSLGGFIGNIFSSGGNLIGGLANTVLHPIQTLQGIGQAISHPSTIIDALKQRYGGLQNIENTLYKDPVGVALDVSTLLGGVGAVGKLAAEGSDVARIGELASQAGEAVNPLTVIGKGIGAVGGGLKNVAQQAAGITTGEGAQALKIAEQSAKTGGDAYTAFRAGFSGADNPETILQDAQQGYQDLVKARSSDYQGKLAQIKEADHSLNIATVGDLKNSFETQLGQLNITRNADGTLNFNESILDSDPRAKRIVQQLDEKVTSAAVNPNPTKLDTLKRFASDAYKPQDPLNTITQVVKNTARDILNKNVPKYAEMTSGYADASQTLQDIKDAVGIGGKAKAETVMNKIMASLNKGKEGRLQALSQLGDNKYLAERIAGYKLSQNFPGGLAAKVAEGGGLGALIHPAAAVPIAGSLLTTSPKLMGAVSQATGLSERAATTLVQAMTRVTGLSPSQVATLLTQANRVSSSVQGNQ